MENEIEHKVGEPLNYKFFGCTEIDPGSVGGANPPVDWNDHSAAIKMRFSEREIPASVLDHMF
jgi:hypothetical protein